MLLKRAGAGFILILLPCLLMILLALPSSESQRQAQAATGEIIRCSSSSSGEEGNDSCSNPAITPDGRYVVFESVATNMVAGDTNAKKDIFRKDLATGETVRCSTGSSGTEGDNDSFNPSLSADGRYVAFDSDADNLVPDDTNVKRDVFRKDLTTGNTVRCSTDPSGAQGPNESANNAISSNGRYVVFASSSNNLVAGDINGYHEVFRKDLDTGEIVLCATDSAGVQGNNYSNYPCVSPDGRYVAFEAESSNLVTGDTNGNSDIFRKDFVTGETVRCSTGSSGNQANSYSFNPSLSADGRYAAFRSYATNLVSIDTNVSYDVFRKDLNTGEVINCSTSTAGTQAQGHSENPGMDSTGRYVVFNSGASLASSYAGKNTVYVKDVATLVVSACSTTDTSVSGDGNSVTPSISSGGTYVVFASQASNLVSDDTNGKQDIFRKKPLVEPRYPRITLITPYQAGTEALVTLNGIEFEATRGDSQVFFGSVPAEEYISWADNKIQVKAPPGIAGNVQVTVTNTLGLSNQVSYNAIAPTMTNLYPAIGSTGKEVKIQGSGFGSMTAGSSVDFGSVRADQFVSWSDTEIKVIAPMVTSSVVQVSVATALGVSGSRTYTIRAPELGGKVQNSRAIGTQFTFYGGFFGETRGGSCVKLDNVLVEEYVSWSDQYITVVVPSGVSGVVDVTVTTIGGTSNALNLNIIPVVGSIEPDSCHIGDVIAIDGDGFGASIGDSKVVFYDTEYGRGGIEIPASAYLSWSQTHIEAKVPYLDPEWEDVYFSINVEGQKSSGSHANILDWYYCFAEGYTGAGFQEYICLGNANPYPAKVTIYYLLPDNYYWDQELTVPANSRLTANVNAEVPDMEVSAYVESDIEIAVERPMYFNYGDGWTGGHDAVASPWISTDWFFAEGYTGPGFDEWVCVLNMSDTDANLTFHFQTAEEGEVVRTATLVAWARSSFKVNDLLGPGYSCSLWLESDQYVVAERSMYFDYTGMSNGHWEGGHCVMGLPGLCKEFYFAEGTTRTGFEQWQTIQNPNDSDIEVTADYVMEAGQGDPVRREYTVGAGKRLTVFVPGEVGMEKDLSVKLASDDYFLAERPMYFQYSGAWEGGHCVIGAYQTSSDWFFAEGYTGAGFDEWLCLQNPGTKESTVEVTYLTQEAGALPTKTVKVAPHSRLTIRVNNDAGENYQLSTRLRVIDGPEIVAERPMYFDFNGWDGGHDVVGYVMETEMGTSMGSASFHSAGNGGSMPVGAIDLSGWTRKE